MSDLHRLQVLFARYVPRLIDRAFYLGFEAVIGEVYRPPEMVEIYVKRGTGSRTSLHPDRLAIDLLLFRQGELLKKTEDYSQLGLYWKQIDPLCRWGGDFKSRPDGNHFSLAYQGRA